MISDKDSDISLLQSRLGTVDNARNLEKKEVAKKFAELSTTINSLKAKNSDMEQEIQVITYTS